MPSSPTYHCERCNGTDDVRSTECNLFDRRGHGEHMLCGGCRLALWTANKGAHTGGLERAVVRCPAFGPSPMTKVMPEMKRLREAEDAHNRRWHPAMMEDDDAATE